MKKAVVITIVVVALLAAVAAVRYHSFPLQDGYRLQGRSGSHGQVYRGHFTKVVDGEVMGVQGSKKGIIFGWVGGGPNRYFILHTQSGQIEWLSSMEQVQKLASYGCPRPDMNKEVNLAGLRSNFRAFVRN